MMIKRKFNVVFMLTDVENNWLNKTVNPNKKNRESRSAIIRFLINTAIKKRTL